MHLFIKIKDLGILQRELGRTLIIPGDNCEIVSNMFGSESAIYICNWYTNKLCEVNETCFCLFFNKSKSIKFLTLASLKYNIEIISADEMTQYIKRRIWLFRDLIKRLDTLD